MWATEGSPPACQASAHCIGSLKKHGYGTQLAFTSNPATKNPTEEFVFERTDGNLTRKAEKQLADMNHVPAYWPDNEQPESGGSCSIDLVDPLQDGTHRIMVGGVASHVVRVIDRGL